MKRVIWFKKKGNGDGYWSFTDKSKDGVFKRTYFVNFYKCEPPQNMGGGIEVDFKDFNLELKNSNGRESTSVWVYNYATTGKMYYAKKTEQTEEPSLNVNSDDLPF